MNHPNIKNIYLIAICGTGMTSLAGLLKDAGFHVTGSDENVYPPMSTLLANKGIEILPGFKKEHIEKGGFDLVIIGNVVTKDNIEVQAVLESGLPYISLPQALSRFFLEGRKSLVVAGTHGKTTTTALLSWALHSTGQEPGFMVGGWLNNFDSNHRFSQGEYFVTEGDEYDTAFFDKEAKFLHYRPFAAILTGVEFDHADIFRDLDHIKSAFGKFVRIIDPGGFLLVEHSDVHARDIVDQAPCTVETYGFSPQADWHIDSFRFENGISHFSLAHGGKKVGDFRLPMIGRHNTLNCAAVLALTLKLGVPAKALATGLKEFKGIKRRQEIVGVKNGVTVIDDFAHHPTAISLTIAAVKSAYPGRRVWAVMEPRSVTTRRKTFQTQLPGCFREADKVVVAKLFSPEKIKLEERLDPDVLIQDIRRQGKEAYFIPEVDDIVEFIATKAESGDIVLIMSSGGFANIHQKLLNRL